MQQPPTPVLKALIICDSVIQEHLTNKWSSIGIFDRIVAPRYPVKHPEVCLYGRLADAEGTYKIDVEFLDLTRGEVVGKLHGLEISVRDRKASPDFGIRTRNLAIPHAGKYEFRLVANGEFLGSAELTAVEDATPQNREPQAEGSGPEFPPPEIT